MSDKLTTLKVPSHFPSSNGIIPTLGVKRAAPYPIRCSAATRNAGDRLRSSIWQVSFTLIALAGSSTAFPRTLLVPATRSSLFDVAGPLMRQIPYLRYPQGERPGSQPGSGHSQPKGSSQVQPQAKSSLGIMLLYGDDGQTALPEKVLCCTLLAFDPNVLKE